MLFGKRMTPMLHASAVLYIEVNVTACTRSVCYSSDILYNALIYIYQPLMITEQCENYYTLSFSLINEISKIKLLFIAAFNFC